MSFKRKNHEWDKGIVSLPLSRDFVWFLVAIILVGMASYVSISILFTSSYKIVEQPFVKKVRSIYYFDKNELAKIYYYGGLCMRGYECGMTIVIQKDGKIMKGNKVLEIMDEIDTEKLTKVIDSANYQVMFQKKFTGTCPIAYDGIAVKYTFHSVKGLEIIDSCEVDINENWELFKTLNSYIKKYTVLE